MENLPEELLIQIFSYLPLSSILSLSLTCKRFSEIINSCHELLSFLTVKFSKDTANYVWIGSRNYINASIFEGGTEKYLEVQGFLADSLTKLSVFDKNLKLSELLDILKFCNILRELEIEENSDNDSAFTKEQLPTYKLEKLKVKGGLNSLRILTNFQTKQLHVYWSSKVNQQSQALAELLVNQKNLEALTFENFSEFSFLFPQNLTQQIQFKLKRLSVKSCSCFYIIKLQDFLNLHKDSLTHIELDFYGYRESKLLQAFKNLKSLKFGTEFLNICGPEPIRYFVPQPILNLHNDVLDLEVLPKIRVLEVSYWNKDFINYSKYFPNIEKLTINGPKSEFFVDVEGFSELKILKVYAKNLTKRLEIPKNLTILKIFVDAVIKDD